MDLGAPPLTGCGGMYTDDISLSLSSTVSITSDGDPRSLNEADGAVLEPG